MKNWAVSIITVCCLITSAFSQMKVALATRQKTFGGVGGIFMNYTVGIKSKWNDSIVIDSVKTIADTASIQVYYNKTEKKYCEFAFSQAMAAPVKCGTCPHPIPVYFNCSKGITVYVSQGKKRTSFKVKKFKQLQDLQLP